MSKYNEVVAFIKANKRNPSRHRLEEHLVLNWIKHNRKLMNKGELRPERAKLFDELLAKMEEMKRVNQYQ